MRLILFSSLLIWQCGFIHDRDAQIDEYYANNPEIKDVDFFYYNKGQNPFSIDFLKTEYSMATYLATCGNFVSDDPNQFDTLKICNKSDCDVSPIKWSCNESFHGSTNGFIRAVLWENNNFWINQYDNGNPGDSIFKYSEINSQMVSFIIDTTVPQIISEDAYIFRDSIHVLDGKSDSYFSKTAPIFTPHEGVSRLIKKNEEQIVVWEKAFEFTVFDILFHNSHLYVCGSKSMALNFEAIVLKLDLNGNLIWEKIFHSGDYPKYDFLSKLIVKPDGTIVGVGASGPPDVIENNMYLVNFDESGSLIKQELFKTEPKIQFLNIHKVMFNENDQIRTLGFGVSEGHLTHIAYNELIF